MNGQEGKTQHSHVFKSNLFVRSINFWSYTAMKKISHSVKKQARRAGALRRFSINPGPDNKEGYETRKATELAALHAALGAQA
jgi:hypothetical protein